MELAFAIIHTLHHYPHVLAFVAGFLAEEILLLVGFLAGQHVVPFWTTVFWGFLGILCVDSLTYLVGKSRFFKNYVVKKVTSSKYKSVANALGDLTHHNLFLSLFFTKFIYGPRMLAIMYLSFKKMNYKKFMIYDATTVALWLLLMMPLAWLAGQGILASFSIVKQVEKGILLIALLYVGILLLERLFISKLLKRAKKKAKKTR